MSGIVIVAALSISCSPMLGQNAQDWKYTFNNQMITVGSTLDLQKAEVGPLGSGTSGSFTATNMGPKSRFQGVFPPGPPFSIEGDVSVRDVETGGVVQFTVRFKPSNLGTRQSGMIVNGITPTNGDSFSLTGLGVVPSSAVTLQTIGPVVADQQFRVGLTLNPLINEDVAGELTLSFDPDTPTRPIDQALQFASGGRTVRFTVPRGRNEAQFDNSAGIGVQTGTLAGTITFNAKFESVGGDDVSPLVPPKLTAGVEATAPTIKEVMIDPQQSGFDIYVTAFSTTREVKKLMIQLNQATGATVTPNTFELPEAVFSDHYNLPQWLKFGGLFRLKQQFSFTGAGGISAIKSVTVTITNSVNSTSMNCSFPACGR